LIYKSICGAVERGKEKIEKKKEEEEEEDRSKEKIR
jgi:hypothetical protein